MELVKREDRYDLYADDGSKIASTSNGKLSLKNCQAIEQDSPLQEYILEVNGEGWDDHLYRGSRKQTEWDVEIEIEVINHGKGEDGLLQETIEPKLDAENCLILKLKL